jgi:M6 family metalloprotease-like protein
VLFAEFDDVEANQEPEEVFAIISPEAETFYSSISYGKMNLQLTPHFEWLRMSKPSREYEFSSYEGHFEYIREAMKLADEVVDFSKYDQVIVLTNPRATAFPAGPSFNANSDFWGITMDGKTILNATTSGYDLNNWGFLWLNHELGHNMGLPDLYLYNSGNQFRDVGTYSIMGNIGGRAPEFFAWERWLLGWLEDDQINCLSNSETFSLSPIELADGLVKSTVIKISNKQAIILESRRAIGYDAGLGNEGVLIYLVDPSIDSGEGALVIFPNDSLNASGRTALLGAGENYTILDMTFTVLESNDKEDIVEVIFAE